jgi:iojap-like ribosome-associated protein
MKGKRLLDVSIDSAPAIAGADQNLPPLEQLILDTLEDDKAENIVVIDLGGKSSIADTMIVASGRSARHVSALADHLIRKLKETGHGRAQIEGKASADWVLIDAGDAIVHIFRPEVRDFYQLERIWTGEAAHAAGA